MKRLSCGFFGLSSGSVSNFSFWYYYINNMIIMRDPRRDEDDENENNTVAPPAATLFRFASERYGLTSGKKKEERSRKLNEEVLLF